MKSYSRAIEGVANVALFELPAVATDAMAVNLRGDDPKLMM